MDSNEWARKGPRQRRQPGRGAESETRPINFTFDPALLQRILVGVIVVCVVGLVILAYFTFWPGPSEVVQGAPYAVLDCAALDLNGDQLPDVLACPGGQAFTLTPFGGGG